MNSLKKLPTFIHQCMTIGEIPTSYKISLTYEEQLMWFCRFLEEEVIPVVNNNSEVVQELKTFIENYFDNLDVQEEINNKLDEMAEDGTLEEIITEYLNIKGMLTFNTLSEMKQATNLINGSKAITLGYYNLNDGGGATYYVREVVNTDVANDKDVVALADTNLIAIYVNESPYLNVKQFGAHEDGITDDYSIIDYCISYARTNNLILQLNKKTYLIEDTLDIDIFADKIEGNNAIINSNTNLLFNFLNNTPYDTSYENNWNVIKDLNIKNIDGTKQHKALYFNTASQQKALAHVTFKNLNISNFEVGVDIFSHSYILSFENCDVYDCDKCFQMLEGGSDYGEKISLVNCCIYNSNYGIYNTNNNGVFHLTNTSVDYNECAFYNFNSFSTTICSNCHIEGNYNITGNLLANNSVLIVNRNKEGTYLFYVPKQHHVINFVNCQISGNYNKQMTAGLTEPGIIKFNNCKYVGGVTDISGQLLNNNSLELYNQNPLAWIRSGVVTEDQLQEGSLIKIEQDNSGNGMVITKKGNGSGDIDLFIKINPNSKQKWRLQYDLSSTTNKQEQIVSTYDYGYFVATAINSQLRPLFKKIKGAATGSGYNLNDLLTPQTIVINNSNDTFMDSNATYIRFHFWCNNMTAQSNFSLSNFKFQEM